MTYLNWRSSLKKHKSSFQFLFVTLVPVLSNIVRWSATAGLICVLVVSIAFGRNRSEFEIISQGSKKGLVDARGNIVIPVVYENLGWSDGTIKVVDDVIGYFEGGLWGLISTKNERVTGATYSSLYPATGAYLVAAIQAAYSKKILYGLLNTGGRAVLGFQYNSLNFSGQGILVSQSTAGRTVYGILNLKEEAVIPIAYDRIKPCQSGYVAEKQGFKALLGFDGLQATGFQYHGIEDFGGYLLVSDHFGRRGLISASGVELVQTAYKSIHLVNDSTVSLQEFPSWELISTSGKKIKEFSYDSIHPVNHGIYRIMANDRQALINIEEAYLLQGNNWEISVPDEQFVLTKKDGKQGVLREGGIVLLPDLYDSIFYSGKHFYAMRLHQGQPRWQIFSTFGSPISSNYFEAVYPMSENLIATKKNGYWGYVDFSGHTVIEYKYDYAWPFEEGRARVNYLGNQGIINTAGEWIVNPDREEVTIVSTNLFIKHGKERSEVVVPGGVVTYYTQNELLPHSFGILEISENYRYGLIDEYGRSVLNPIFDTITENNGGVYVVKKDEQYGVLNSEGEFLIALTDRYQAIEQYSEGLLRIKSNDRYGFVDLDGNLRIANRYDEAGDFNSGVAAIKLMGSWGFIDNLDRISIQPLYDSVEDFTNGICLVSKNGAYGIINLKGKEVLGVKYDSITRNQFGSFVVEKSGQYGLANGKGELVVTVKYELLEENRNGFLIIKKRGKYGVVNKKGINVIPTVYDYIFYDSINNYYLAARNPGKSLKIVK